MRKAYCDRCGSEQHTSNLVAVRVGNSISREICPECRRKFEEWMKNFTSTASSITVQAGARP